MKNLKNFLSLTLIVLFAMTSCQKEATVSPLLQEDLTSKVEETTFISANQANIKEEMILLEQILNGEFENEGQSQESSSLRTYCCAMNSLTKVTSPWGDVNLNLKYDVSTTSQEVQIKHWHKPPGGSYSYYGMDVIGSSYTTCTSKSVNLSTGQLPDQGEFISWARIYNGSSYCGGSQVLQWTK